MSAHQLDPFGAVVGKFHSAEFVLPYAATRAHHAAPWHHITGDKSTGSELENFIPMDDSDNVADAIVKYLSVEGGGKSVLCVGGCDETQGGVLYSKVAPLMSAYVKSNASGATGEMSHTSKK